MKRFFVIMILASAVCFSGCDGLRKLAGRPTLAEIDAIRAETRAREEALHQARIDSLERVRKALADSLALDSLRQQKGTILNPAKMGGLFTTKLDYKYYIVVGAFKQRSGAERKVREVNAAGYTATLISFRNGFNAVSVFHDDDLNVILRKMKTVREEPFCPGDVWILVNE